MVIKMVKQHKQLVYLAVMMVMLLLAVLGCSVSNPTPKAEGPGVTPGTKTRDTAPSSKPPATSTKTNEQVIFVHPVQDLNTLPIHFGQAKGLFAAEGLTVNFQVMSNGAIIPALIAGEVDYTGVTNSVVAAALQKAPVKIVRYLVDKMTFSLWGQPDVQKVADLKGKLIALSAINSSQRNLIQAMLTPGKLKLADVTLLSVNTTPNCYLALKSGQVAAAVLVPPIDVLAETEGYNLLARSSDYLERPMSGISTTDKIIKGNPEQIKKMLRATMKIIIYMKAHPQEVIDYIVSTEKLDPDLAKKAYNAIMPYYSETGMGNEEIQRELIKAAAEDLELTQEIPLNSVYDFSLLLEVNRELSEKK